MPVNQPTQYIQRGPRNYVNISGAILTPFAQGLGEVASQGFKDMLGFSTPAEDYQRQLTAAMEDSRMRNADKDWQERLAQADGGQYANNPDAQKQWAMDRYGWDEDRAGRWANSTAHDSVEAMRMRNTSQAQFAGNALDPMPGPITQAMQGQTPGINPTAPPFPSPSVPFPSASAPLSDATTPATPPAPQTPMPASPNKPTSVRIGEEVSQSIQRAQEASVNPSSPPAPGAASMVNTPPPSPGTVSGMAPGAEVAPPVPLTPQAAQDLQRQLQAYQARQIGNLNLYKQAAKAALTGTIDEKQMALSATLANTQEQDITDMMRKAGPYLGLPERDLDGQPINGDVMLDGLVTAQLSRLRQTPDQLEKFKAANPTQYDAMTQAEQRLRSRISRMSINQAEAFQKGLEPVLKNNLISPEAAITYMNHRASVNQAAIEHRDNVRLKEVALSQEQQRIVSESGLRNVQTRAAQVSLELLQRYAPQQEVLKIRQAEMELRNLEEARNIKLDENARANLTTDMAAYDSMIDNRLKIENNWATRQEKALSNLITQSAKAEQNIELVSKTHNMAIMRHTDLYSKARETPQATVDAWLQKTLPQEWSDISKMSAADRFDRWYQEQPGNQDWKSYKTDMNRAQKQYNDLQGLIDAAASQVPPQPGDEETRLMGSAANLANSALAHRMRNTHRVQAREIIKQHDPMNWAQALDDDSTLVNKITNQYANTATGFRLVNAWDKADSTVLLHLARITLQRGGNLIPPENLGKEVMDGKSFSVRYGKNYQNFYNAYATLTKELK